MALDKYLITKEDIKVYRPTAELDDARIKPFILEAQRLDLKPVLNDALFYDFVLKFDETLDSSYAKYQELLTGKVYTYNSNSIYFDGIKPMLSYYALARFVIDNPINITRMSIVVKTVNQSTPADASQIKMFVNELRSAAMSYQNQVVKFLCDNSTTYPLYNSGGASSDMARTTSFNFFKG
jgi:hypothetical protein